MSQIRRSGEKLIEWTVIELQGDIGINNGKDIIKFENSDKEMINKCKFGELSIVKKKETESISLAIGNQKLVGKVVNLKRKLAVVVKDDNSNDLIIKGFIKKKLLFSKRPIPITNLV